MSIAIPLDIKTIVSETTLIWYLFQDRKFAIVERSARMFLEEAQWLYACSCNSRRSEVVKALSSPIQQEYHGNELLMTMLYHVDLLTCKQQGRHKCILSIVASDALVKKHQAMCMQSAD